MVNVPIIGGTKQRKLVSFQIGIVFLREQIMNLILRQIIDAEMDLDPILRSQRKACRFRNQI